MQQVIVIHGGSTFWDYNDYLKSLSEKVVSLDRLIYRPMWKDRLQIEIGDDFQVLLPKMPNSANARYIEWKLWFDSMSSLFEDDCILVGHSLGAIFLAKYLSEKSISVKIKATVFVAAPYDDESIEDLTDFKITELSEQLTEQAGRMVFFNGHDDPVVSASDLHKYQQRLPNAEFMILPAPDHFVRNEFPELTNLLKNINQPLS